jgi:hypothetical protein
MANTKLENILTAGSIASNLLGGVAAGKASSAERARQAVLDQQALLNAQYEREANARALQMANLTRQQQDQLTRAQSVLGAMPLGAEQNYVSKQRILGSIFGNLQNQPESSAYGGVVNPAAGMNLSSFADPATAQALAERRKTIAGVNPNFQFGAMGAYGLTDTLTPEQQVSQYARDVASQRMAQENALTNMLNAQFNAAQQMGQTQLPPTSQPAAQPEKKKTSIWKKIAKVGLAAAPIIAAPFTGGTSLALIGAGAGAAGGALDGGWKGALTGGATGALTGGLGGGANAAQGVAGAVKESAGSAIKRAILNPRALTQIGSAALPDQVGQAVRIAALALPGAKAAPTLGSPSTVTPPTNLTLAPMFRGQLDQTGTVQFQNMPGYNAPIGTSPSASARPSSGVVGAIRSRPAPAKNASPRINASVYNLARLGGLNLQGLGQAAPVSPAAPDTLSARTPSLADEQALTLGFSPLAMQQQRQKLGPIQQQLATLQLQLARPDLTPVMRSVLQQQVATLRNQLSTLGWGF